MSQRVREVLSRHRDHLLRIPGVRNASYSTVAITDGQVRSVPCIRVIVKEKKKPTRNWISYAAHVDAMQRGGTVHVNVSIPETIEDVEVDVVSFPTGIRPLVYRAQSMTEALAPTQEQPTKIDLKQYDTLQGGIGYAGTRIAAQGLGTGNIACTFPDTPAGSVDIINNFHVARTGDNLFQPMITRPIAMKCIDQVIPPDGDLSRSQGTPTGQNGVNGVALGVIVETPNAPVVGWEEPQVGMNIDNRGVTAWRQSDFYGTGQVTSFLDRIDVDYSSEGVNVNYVQPKFGVWEILGPDVNHPIGGAGHSGSAVRNMASNRLVGVFTWGGTDDNNIIHGFMQSWHEVQNKWGEPGFSGSSPQPPTPPPSPTDCQTQFVQDVQAANGDVIKILLALVAYFQCSGVFAKK